MAMYVGAAAIAAGTEQRVRCRNPNLVRTAYVMEWKGLRLRWAKG